jgi:hypothetical protein
LRYKDINSSEHWMLSVTTDATKGKNTVWQEIAALPAVSSWSLNTFNINTSAVSNYLKTNAGAGAVPLWFRLEENTLGNDIFKLDTSEISVTYTTSPPPVPVPSTALLLGSSLLGLVGFSSRRRS